MNPKCIIFDCDGVLVDSEEITNRVLVEMGNALGIDLDFAYARTGHYRRILSKIFALRLLTCSELRSNPSLVYVSCWIRLRSPSA